MRAHVGPVPFPFETFSSRPVFYWTGAQRSGGGGRHSVPPGLVRPSRGAAPLGPGAADPSPTTLKGPRNGVSRARPAPRPHPLALDHGPEWTRGPPPTPAPLPAHARLRPTHGTPRTRAASTGAGGGRDARGARRGTPLPWLSSRTGAGAAPPLHSHVCMCVSSPSPRGSPRVERGREVPGPLFHRPPIGLGRQEPLPRLVLFPPLPLLKGPKSKKQKQKQEW